MLRYSEKHFKYTTGSTVIQKHPQKQNIYYMHMQ